MAEPRRQGVFTIPSVEEMKRASMITSGEDGANRFRATASESVSDKPRPQPRPPREREEESSCGLALRPGGVGVKESAVDLAVSDVATVQEGGRRAGEWSGGGRRAGEWSGGGDAVAMSTAAETSGAASTHQPHPHAIVANPVQKKNPVMKHIRNVPWELGDIVPDFLLGRSTCALFLSVRYHSLQPEYIHTRLKELGKQYELRILLVLVDMSDCQKVLHELAKIAILANLTLIVAWSYEEAGRYLETYKAYEHKPPDLLMERVDSNFTSQVTESLTTIKKVNKTDAITLLNTFKTMEGVISASKEELTLCPGLGPQKAQRLYDVFHEPFVRPKTPRL